MPPSTAERAAIAGYRQQLLAALLDERPNCVVLIGPDTLPVSEELALHSESNAGMLTVLSFSNIDSATTSSPLRKVVDGGGSLVALLSLAAGDESWDRSLGKACLAFPDRLLVEHTVAIGTTERVGAGQANEPEASPNRFFAFGFKRRMQHTSERSRRSLYEFRLRDYKQAPEWLNARFWAHPERFDAPGS